jgi:hypothetical protein
MRLSVMAMLLMFGIPSLTSASKLVNLEGDENLERSHIQTASKTTSVAISKTSDLPLTLDAQPSFMSRMGAALYPIISSLISFGGTAQSPVETETSTANQRGVLVHRRDLDAAPVAASNDDALFLPHTVMHYVIHHKDIITIEDKRFQIHVDMIDFDTFHRTGELGMSDTAEWGSKVYLSRLYFKKMAKADDHIFFIGEGKTPIDTAHAYGHSYPGMRFFMALIALDGPIYEPLLPVVSAYKLVTRKAEPFPTTSLSWMEPSYKFKQKGAHPTSPHTSYGEIPPTQQSVQRRSGFPLFIPRLIEGASPLPESSPEAGTLSPEYERIFKEHEQKIMQLAVQEREYSALLQRQRSRADAPSIKTPELKMQSKSRMIRPSVEYHRARGFLNPAMDYGAVASKRLNLKANQREKKSRVQVSLSRNVSASAREVGPSKSRMIRPSVQHHRAMELQNPAVDYIKAASQHLKLR